MLMTEPSLVSWSSPAAMTLSMRLDHVVAVAATARATVIRCSFVSATISRALMRLSCPLSYLVGRPLRLLLDISSKRRSLLKIAVWFYGACVFLLKICCDKK